jgi:hypothetical protein
LQAELLGAPGEIGDHALAVSLLVVLLVQDRKDGKVTLADGYQRPRAVGSVSKDAWIPCKIA